jgi:hypothetical protein
LGPLPSQMIYEWTKRLIENYPNYLYMSHKISFINTIRSITVEKDRETVFQTSDYTTKSHLLPLALTIQAPRIPVILLLDQMIEPIR